MKDPKVKLLAAAISLLTAMVLLASGTFAWFTLSTQAMASGLQVSMDFTGEEWPFECSLDGMNYSKNVDVTAVFSRSGDAVTYLRPISTADGVNWYLPNYDQIGGVNGFRPVSIDSVGSYLTEGGGSILADDSNYLVYYDMWVRTLDKDTDYYLKISNPLASSKILDEETYYGSYVVSMPEKTAAGGYILPPESEDATSCIRLGFLVLENYDPVAMTADPGLFTVYEPNADKKSGDFTNNDEYSASTGLIYVAGKEEGTGKTVGEYGTITGSELALLPYDDNGTIKMRNDVRTVRQYSSYWDEARLASLTSGFPDSSFISTFGAFVVGSDNQATNEKYWIARVPHYDKTKSDAQNKGVLIRVFIWLEGQDQDCWNEIREGKIFANLEFKGDPVN